MRAELGKRGLVTQAGLYARISAQLASGGRPPYDAIVVDKAQNVRRSAATVPGRAFGSRPVRGQVAIATMHLAKGLEFRAVAVMACDDEIVPLQSRIGAVTDEGDLQEVYDTERHLLYVACTRARDQLIVTGVEPASEFLDDMVSSRREA